MQPMYDYLVYNPQAYDKSYAVNQYTESQVLSLSVKKGDYDGNALCWNLKESLKPGKYFVEIMFESPQDGVNLPIYDTANYDVYSNGYVCIQGRKKKNADLLFSVSDGKR